MVKIINPSLRTEVGRDDTTPSFFTDLSSVELLRTIFDFIHFAPKWRQIKLSYDATRRFKKKKKHKTRDDDGQRYIPTLRPAMRFVSSPRNSLALQPGMTLEPAPSNSTSKRKKWTEKVRSAMAPQSPKDTIARQPAACRRIGPQLL
jgi:hypothetical protein